MHVDEGICVEKRGDIMKNIGITSVCEKNANDFTNAFGIRLRRVINPFLRMAFKIATKRKVYVEKYPNLPKEEVYIFASTHSFDEDVLAGLANLDRHAWLLNGTTHQIYYNPQMYAA